MNDKSSNFALSSLTLNRTKYIYAAVVAISNNRYPLTKENAVGSVPQSISIQPTNFTNS